MRTLFSWVLFTLFLTSAWAGETLNSMAALINDDVITTRDVTQYQQALKEQTDLSVSHKKALNMLIDKHLQEQAAALRHIQVSKEELLSAMNGVAKQHHVTLKELPETLKKRGIAFHDFQKTIQSEILLSKLHQQVLGEQLTLSDKEIQKIIKTYQQHTETEYHLVDVLIPFQANQAKKIAQHKAQQLLQTVRKGQTLTGNAYQQTDLEWRTIEDIPSAFTSHLKTLKKGSWTGPIETGNGMHLLHLKATREAPRPIDLTEAQAREIAFQEKAGTALQAWLKTLRSQAFIKIMT